MEFLLAHDMTWNALNVLEMQRKFQKLLFHFEVSTVAADSIALLGAKASAGIAMTKYRQVS